MREKIGKVCYREMYSGRLAPAADAATYVCLVVLKFSMRPVGETVS